MYGVLGEVFGNISSCVVGDSFRSKRISSKQGWGKEKQQKTAGQRLGDEEQGLLFFAVWLDRAAGWMPTEA